MKEGGSIIDYASASDNCANMDGMTSPSSSDVCVVKSLAIGISHSESPSGVTMASSDSLSSYEATDTDNDVSLEEAGVAEEKKEHAISFTDDDDDDGRVVLPGFTVPPLQVVPLDQILNPNISFANEVDGEDDDDDDDENPLASNLSSSSSDGDSDNASSLDAEEEEDEEALDLTMTKATSFDTDESNIGDILHLVSSSPTGSTTDEEEEDDVEEDTRFTDDNNIAQLDVPQLDTKTQLGLSTQFVPSQEDAVKRLQEDDPLPVKVEEGTLMDLSGSELQSSNNDKNNNKGYDLPPVFPAWTRVTKVMQQYLQRFLVALALVSARNPIRCIVSVTAISLGLLMAGLATNFHITVDETVIYAPFNTLPRIHQRWFNEDSGLGNNIRGTILMIRNKDDDGDNAGFLSRDTVKRVFQALDTVRNTTGFQDIVCQDGAYWDEHAQQFTCRIMAATRFWYHDQSLFEDQVKSDEDLLRQLSATQYPGGAPVDPSYIMGNYQRDDNGIITYAPAFFVYLFLTDKPETVDFEGTMLQRLAMLQREWEQDPSIPVILDYTSVRSPADEFRRAISDDMYLLPIVFFMMSGFTCLVYFKPHDLVQSRCLLGVGMVTTTLMAMFTGFGIMFIFGVPFTSMTQLLPFVLFGVGYVPENS
jgi:Patched family